MNALVAGGNYFGEIWAYDSRPSPEAVAFGALRMNAAVWSVYDDMRNGRLSPRAFGASTWSELTSARLYALAQSRVRHNTVDLAAAADRMIADDSLAPIMLTRQDGARVPLDTNTYSYRLAVARIFQNLPADFDVNELGGRAGQLAVAITDAPDDEGRIAALGDGGIELAAAMLNGTDNSPATASGVLQLLAAATGTTPYVSVPFPTDQPTELTMQRLIDAAERGEGMPPGFVPGQGFVEFRPRTPDGMVAEIRRRFDAGELNYLSVNARAQLSAMLGEGSQVGVRLRSQLSSEETSRGWREFFASVTADAIIFTAGTLVGAGPAAAAGRGANTLYRTTRVGQAILRNAPRTAGVLPYAAVSGTITTALDQVIRQRFDARQYPINIAMVGGMLYAQRLAQTMASALSTNGRMIAVDRAMRGFLNVTVPMTAAAIASTTTGIGLQYIDAHQTPTLAQAQDMFVRNLLVSVATHRASVLLRSTAPRLSADYAAFASECTRLRTMTDGQQSAMALQTVAVETALARVGQLRGLPQNSPQLRTAVAEYEAALQRYNTMATEARRTLDEVSAFADRYLPANEATALRNAFSQIDASATPPAPPPPQPAPDIVVTGSRRAQTAQPAEDTSMPGNARWAGIVEGADTPQSRSRASYNALVTNVEQARAAVARISDSLEASGITLRNDGRAQVSGLPDIGELVRILTSPELSSARRALTSWDGTSRALATEAFPDASNRPAAPAAVGELRRALSDLEAQIDAARHEVTLRQDVGESVTGNMLREHIGEETRGITYLTEAERTTYEVTIRNGVLYDSTGQRLNTHGGPTSTEPNSAIFVLSADGRLYVSSVHDPGRFHHSSLVAGAPVRAAGEVVVVNGQIRSVIDKSGHYYPNRYMMRQLGVVLRDNGVNVDTVRFDSIMRRNIISMGALLQDPS